MIAVRIRTLECGDKEGTRDAAPLLWRETTTIGGGSRPNREYPHRSPESSSPPRDYARCRLAKSCAASRVRSLSPHSKALNPKKQAKQALRQNSQPIRLRLPPRTRLIPPESVFQSGKPGSISCGMVLLLSAISPAALLAVFPPVSSLIMCQFVFLSSPTNPSILRTSQANLRLGLSVGEGRGREEPLRYRPGGER